MFVLAILLGIYSYALFFLGIFGLLITPALTVITIVFVVLFVFLLRGRLGEFRNTGRTFSAEILKDRIFSGVLLFIVSQAFVNLIGTLGPELAFDALWYHLTLPKLYLLEGKIFFIPGNLLYYSAMPKLTEMFYIPALAIQGEIFAKIIHYLFGLLTCIVLYQLAGRYFTRTISLVVVLVFYTNLVVAWESITAYIDLTRTFYEVMAFLSFVLWVEKRKEKYLILTGILTGFAITAKLLAFGTGIIFLVLLGFDYQTRKKQSKREIMRRVGLYSLSAITVPLPWLVFSYVYTGNPVYPFFTDLYSIGATVNLLNPIRMVQDVFMVFVMSPDPIIPLYLICLPLVVLLYKKMPYPIKIATIYSLLALVMWYITPRTGGGRFLMPYLPVFSFLVGYVFVQYERKKLLYRFLLISVIFFGITSLVYRGVANAKYIPVILGKESRDDFLTEHLNFSFGDFYDTDGYFEKNIKETDSVLLFGFHNLYYVDFPFIHASWLKEGDRYNYIAVQNTDLPKEYTNFRLIYESETTHVKLYSLERYITHK